MEFADASAHASSHDEAHQEELLPGVSRTFALTIPQLPPPLKRVVTNAYLLCRIADTIEDDTLLTPTQKQRFHRWFVAIVAGRDAAHDFAATLTPLLSADTLPAERALIRDTAGVIRVTRSLNANQRDALSRCLGTMCQGMPRFQRSKSLRGLRSLQELDQYCYYVAGVVGEMLTDLFCDYSPEIAVHRERMHRLAVCFGQGLQMTNILKDIWEDRRSETCWLPRDVFGASGVDLARLDTVRADRAFAEGLETLVGVAHAHLRRALQYTLLVPPGETGIRRFCLWAIGLAVLTLRKIHGNPTFTNGRQVKVSRRTVRATILLSNMAIRSDRALTLLFNLSAKGLPLSPLEGEFCSERAAA